MKSRPSTGKLLVVFILGIALPLGTLACKDAESPVAAVMRDISPEAFLASPPENAFLLDVRTESEFTRGHVPGARHIPHVELADRVLELGAETDRPIVVYCESGKRASIAGNTLIEAGFTNVLHLEGDMRGWRQSGRAAE